MAEVRVLRERKRLINYNEDVPSVHFEWRNKAAIRAQAVEVDGAKENRKRRTRSSSRQQGSPDDEDSSSDQDEGIVRPQAKRAKSPPRRGSAEKDLIEDTDDGRPEFAGNCFVAFARRAGPAATKADGRPQRTAALRANRRLSETATAAKGDRGDDKGNARGTDSDVEMVDASSSSDEDSNVDEEEEDRIIRRKAPTRATTRKQPTRAARKQTEVVSSESGPEESDSDDSDDYADEEQGAGGGKEAPKRGPPARTADRFRRPVARSGSEDSDGEDDSDDEGKGQEDAGRKRGGGQAQGGSADSDDSDVQVMNDEDESGSSIDGSESGGDNAEGGGNEADEENEEDSGEHRRRSTRGEKQRKEARQKKASYGDLCAGEECTRKGNQASEGRQTAKGKDKKNKSKSGSKDKEATKHKVKGTDKQTDQDDAKVKGREKESDAAKGKAGTKAGAAPKGEVQRILSHDPAKDLFRVKLEGVSYRNTAYVKRSYLEHKKLSLLRAFLSKELSVEIEPEWLQVERVIAVRGVSKKGSCRQYLVKWRGLEYSDATWEDEGALESEEDKAAIARFKRYNAPGRNLDTGSINALRQPDFELPTFCNGRKLRDYQQVSVRWMVNNYCQSRNCILGDEMGLGKTAQSISTLETIRTVGGVSGPFLIVAPLTTLGHWQREVETWTDMNVVLLAGSTVDRALIVEHEFFRGPSAGGGLRKAGRPSQRTGEIKFDVLLVSYDTLLKERSLLRSISWAAAVFDEAHRLKGINSSTRAAVEEMDIDWLLLLTGTPIQNNILELFAILSLLDPEAYPSQEDFTARFGGSPGGAPPTIEQIKALQAALAPVLLRRMKEDVEELPEKEEVVIWVELTQHQRLYYRSVYEGQIGALLGGGKLPAMRNLAMELRKLCCHPVLCDGLEEDLSTKLAIQRSQAPAGVVPEFPCPELELLVRGSGKMVLLHKLLPKLRAEGRRVLIFSQFVIMLNVLEDYCRAAGFPVERIDGSVTGRARQQAIDRFCAEDAGDDGAFVFLLSTRAGGQGITLTAADTCIIYDSDWNPQNDLQAMARCHRIGQKKEVTVYRLISRDTYEMALFSTASKKYGLDEAILGFSAGTDPEADAARISELLRNGAHGLLSDMEAGVRQGEAFASENINQILEARTEKRQIGSRAGNTFSVATFAVDDAAGGALGGDGRMQRPTRKSGRRPKAADDDGDKEYWRALMPEAVAAHEAQANTAPVILGPRKRTKVNYNLDAKKYKLSDSDSSSDSDQDGAVEAEVEKTKEAKAEAGGSSVGGEADGDKKRRGSKNRKSEGGAAEGAEAQEARARARKLQGQRWTKAEIKALEQLIVGFGPDRWEDVYARMHPTRRTLDEVEEAGRALWNLYGVSKSLAEKRFLKRDAIERAAYEEAVAKATKEAEERRAAKEAARAAKEATGGSVDDSNDNPDDVDVYTLSFQSGILCALPKSLEPDEFDDELMAELSKLPEVLRVTMANAATVKRLLKDSGDVVRHGKMMSELATIMRAKPEPAAAAMVADGSRVAEAKEVSEAMGANATIYKAAFVSATGLPSWWFLPHDDALLHAVVEVGFPPGHARRAIEHALRNAPLSEKVVLKTQDLADGDGKAEMPPVEGANPAAKEETSAAAQAAEPSKQAEVGAGAAGRGRDNKLMAEADTKVESTLTPSPGVPSAEAPKTTSKGPEEMTKDEWQRMIKVLVRRMTKLVSSTVDYYRRHPEHIATGNPYSNRAPPRPVVPPAPARPAVGPLAAVATAGGPSSGSARPGQDSAKPAAVAQNIPAAPTRPSMGAEGPALPQQQKRLQDDSILTERLAPKLPRQQLQQQTTVGEQAATKFHHKTNPQLESNQPSQQHRHKTGASGDGVAPAAAGAPAAGATSGGVSGGKKQSTLPFSRLPVSKSTPNPTAAAATAKTAGVLAPEKRPGGVVATSGTPEAAFPAKAQPCAGSAERPIMLDGSE